MKAIYQSPKTDVLSISLTHMIAVSSPEKGQNLNEAPITEETSGNLSRRRDVWDDEEEEEEF